MSMSGERIDEEQIKKDLLEYSKGQSGFLRIVVLRLKENYRLSKSNSFHFKMRRLFNDGSFNDPDIPFDELIFLGILQRWHIIEFKQSTDFDCNVETTAERLDYITALLTGKPAKKPSEDPSKETYPWDKTFVWKGKTFIFGNLGNIKFNSKPRSELFKVLTNKQGGWAKVAEMAVACGKNDPFVRATINQIAARMSPALKKCIKIISTQGAESEEMPVQGAYRIQYTKPEN